MPLTETERARLRVQWRRLTVAAAQLDIEGMRAVTQDAPRVASPLDEKASAFTLFALSYLGFAYVRGGAGYRLQAGPLLKAAAALVGDLLDASDPAPSAQPPPQLPFRADLDR